MSARFITVDGNEAAATIAHKLSETAVIYPITPSSTMGELADEWSAGGRRNLFGTIPQVVEMQSEAGAIGAVHGALQAGSLVTSFTASQGLLLMIPNLYKIAGELLPFVLHVAARTVATHALSIFGDHSDVMAVRQTGCCMLSSHSVQEAQDIAAISHAATLACRIPFIHFFDGFRTSHEVQKIVALEDEHLRQLIDYNLVEAHRARALTPDRPMLRGSAQNPDVFFQARESANPFYDGATTLIRHAMKQFADLTGRSYDLFEYVGHPRAGRVIVAMGSATQTIEQVVERLNRQGERVGLVKVRLFRPFSAVHLARVIPSTARSIAVLDRTKEPGAIGDPLYLDVMGSIHQQWELLHASMLPIVVGGRYGLSSKEFTPAMVKSVFDELSRDVPRHGFTVGIVDDVTYRSLPIDENFALEKPEVVRAVFYGLGSDGTVSANKNSIKIIGDETDLFAQGYFVYDSKKSGAMTVSHLRFGPKPIRSPYLIRRAEFVACHQWQFIDQLDMLDVARPGATFLVNAPYPADQVWNHLPREMQQQIIEKKLKVFTIDAYKVAEASGMGRRINTVMQTAFFALAGILPKADAIDCIKKYAEKTYKRKGNDVVMKNWEAIDHALASLHEVPVPSEVTSSFSRSPTVPDSAPEFVKRVTALMMAGLGDRLPVSAFPPDGTWPTGTTRFEKRNIAAEIPIWHESQCIQCNKCVLVCPHAAIRAKVVDGAELAGKPEGFKSMPYKAPDFKGQQYVLQVAPEDCTGCQLCVNVCPAKDKSDPKRKAISMQPRLDHVEREREWFDFFLKLPEVDRTKVVRLDAKGTQLLQPLFEFSGACAACGETPYIKLLTQLYGDRLMIANATGCSSIFGGNLPTAPWCKNPEGRGPAWSNSLFEDNAEFGLGMRLGVDQLQHRARLLMARLAPKLSAEIVEALSRPAGGDETGVRARREAVRKLRSNLAAIDTPEARELAQLADYFVDKSVWLIGGDGWAYDIGFGGLDHVLATGRKVNVLVLDTEVYSNTGGQASKATPLGAAAKFAAAGKQMGRKDLGLMAMSYGHVYVAQISMGANDNHAVKVLQEAESYEGPSLVIAYSHCLAHGYGPTEGLEQQKRAVACGIWPLYRFDPRRKLQGLPPLQIDSKPPTITVEEYTRHETRFGQIKATDPARFEMLGKALQADTQQRLTLYEQLAKIAYEKAPDRVGT